MTKRRATLFICVIQCIILLKSINARNYTQEELSKLKLIDERTKTVRNQDFMKTNGYLIRWLRAKNMDVDKATDMLFVAMKWRKDNQIDNLLKEQPIPEYIRHPYYNFDSIDKEGSPVSIVEARKFDVRKYAVAGLGRQLSRMNFYLYEKMEDKIHEIVSKTGRNVSQGFSIMDADGYNLRQHGCLACIPTFMEGATAFERYYPGLYKRFIAINVPRIALPVYELVKPLLSPITQKVLSIYGTEELLWQAKLLHYVPADQLPRQYGGTKL